MHAINGTYRNGQIILAQKADWPEDTKVRVEPMREKPTLGIRDEDWPTDPEGIAQLLALIDSFEPVEMTAEAAAEYQSARKAQAEYDRTNFDERLDRIQRSFE